MKQETDYIYSIPKFAGKSTPDNTLELLRRIGFREEDRKIIHVAGTNGKGSVCSYIANTLLADNRTVGLFVSPHLLRINERMRINGKEVSDEVFEESFAKVKAISEDMAEAGYTHPSFFEFLFGMAMDIFTRENVEYIVLETGLGGRLDATNVITNPIVTIITSIGLDHTDILGDTIEAIAGEKAGIIKENVPVVFWNKNDGAAKVITGKAKELNSPMYSCSREDIGNVIKRDVLPDPLYNDKVVTRLINNVMIDGKKGVAQKIVYGAFEIIGEKTGKNPLEVFKEAMENVMPVLEVKARRVGGATYQVPIDVRPERRQTLGLRWITLFSRQRNERTMKERLANEILDALNNAGGAVKRKDEMHRMAEANNAFSHYRF